MKRRLWFIPLFVPLLSLPVFAAKDSSDTGGGNNLVYFLFVSLFVIFVAYYATRWIGKYAKGLGNSRGRLIKIAESIYLGPNRGLHLVLVGKKLYLIGQADQGLTILAELDDEELLQQAQSAGESSGMPSLNGFGQQLQKFLARDAQQPFMSLGSAEQLRQQLDRLRHRKERGE